MSERVELFDGRRAEVILQLAGNKAWVRTDTGQELVDLADVAPVVDVKPPRRCGVAKPKRPKLPQLPPTEQPPAHSDPEIVVDPLPPFEPTPFASRAMDVWPVRTNLRKTFRGPDVVVNPDWLDRWRRAHRPAPIAGSHAHYWILDAASIGTCSVCGVVKDFRQKLMDLDPFNAGHRRPRKEAEIE